MNPLIRRARALCAHRVAARGCVEIAGERHLVPEADGEPLTARLLSGTIMGGTRLGQEYAGGDAPDWAKIGISTGLGFFLPAGASSAS